MGKHFDYKGNVDAKPWDRLPDETHDAFLAFCVYRDMVDTVPGGKRSIRGALRKVNPNATKMNTRWFQWSAKHNWASRVLAFDQWRQAIKDEEVKNFLRSKEQLAEENREIHRADELYLSEQMARKAKEILDIPLVKRTHTETRDGKLIIVKSHLLSPGHLLAAVQLAKAASELGRKSLGILDSDATGQTADDFRSLFYKTTGETAKHLPAGAMPPVPEDAAVNPGVDLPAGYSPVNGASTADSGGTYLVPAPERP